MILARSIVPLLGMVLTSFYLIAAVNVANVATQSPDDSNGWHIPEGAAMERNPEPLNAAVLAKGQRLYEARCQRCHGADGAGHGPESDPNHPASDLTDGRVASRNPDGVMFYKIWNGRAKPKMPTMKTDITRTDVWTVIHYVKTLRKR
jgi:mono/diheme cytochrome c family protein